MTDGAALDDLAAAIEAVLAGKVVRHVPSSELTSYRRGGPLAVLARIESVAALLALRPIVMERRVPFLVIGRGSNLLVAERGFDGLALLLGGTLESLEVEGTSVRAGAAVGLPVLARRTAAEGLGGLEFYVGIPGSVGGAVRMNAGGHGSETAQVLSAATVLDLFGVGVIERRTVDELDLGSRRSGLTRSEVVLGAEFNCAAEGRDICEARLAEIVRWRREHQPGGQNAGSVFVNPPGDAAGRLIDACGLKGLRMGGAVVSSKHANFIQAEEGATADDVAALIREVQRRVADATGVVLQPEIQLVGFEEHAS